jgi:hypothetical protein
VQLAGGAGGGDGTGGDGGGGDGGGGGGDGGDGGRGGAAAIVAVMSPYDDDIATEAEKTFAGFNVSVSTNVSRATKAMDGKYTTVDTTALPAE